MAVRGTILIVDDEAELREVLDEYLSGQGYSVVLAETAEVARALCGQRAIDLAVLDIRLPGEDGLSLARHLRERYKMGIVMLTSAGTVLDRIVGLEMGADDYLPKPFDPRELLARIESILRRASGSVDLGASRVRVGRCVLDLESHRLTDESGAVVPMSALEYELLKALIAHPNQVLSRERILNLATRNDLDPFDRSVDLRILRLRRKIEPDSKHPRYIRSVRSEGYVFLPSGGEA